MTAHVSGLRECAVIDRAYTAGPMQIKSKSSPHRTPKGKSLTAEQLALLSNAVFDVPPRTRLILSIIGAIGGGIVVMESLVSNRPEQIQLDKIIHFSGYAMLAFTFALALRPVAFVPAVTLLTAMGVAIEFLQARTGRSFDT